VLEVVEQGERRPERRGGHQAMVEAERACEGQAGDHAIAGAQSERIQERPRYVEQGARAAVHRSRPARRSRCEEDDAGHRHEDRRTRRAGGRRLLLDDGDGDVEGASARLQIALALEQHEEGVPRQGWIASPGLHVGREQDERHREGRQREEQRDGLRAIGHHHREATSRPPALSTECVPETDGHCRERVSGPELFLEDERRRKNHGHVGAGRAAL
jgi:hypothetical protein